MEEQAHPPAPDFRDPDAGPPPNQPFFNLPGIILAALVAMAVIEAAQAWLLDRQGLAWLLYQGAFVPGRYGGEGTAIDGPWFWTPVTYSLLHGGWLHLIVNGFWLAAFGSLVARRIGTARFLLLWVLSAIASAALFTAFHWGEYVVMVGASGVVSALMAAAARFAFSARRSFVRQEAHLNPRLSVAAALRNRSVFSFLAVWFGINLLAAFGVAPGAGEAAIAWEAHVGGFLFGFLLFDWFDRGDGPRESPYLP